MLPCCIITGLTIGLISTLIITGKRFILKVLGRPVQDSKWERPTREV